MTLDLEVAVLNYLTVAGIVGGGTGWPCYVGYMPDDIPQTVAVFPTGGYPADTLGRENLRPTCQVRVRAARLSYAVARAKWQAIFDALQDAKPGLVGSPDPLKGYAFIQAMQTAPLQFNDANGRPNFTSNWRAMLTR
jgi:hypothetical protein